MNQKRMEQLVGTFLLIGLLVVGALIVVFGRINERFQSNYTINVEFPNASDLIVGAPVSLAGAPIGRVAGPPSPVDEGLTVLVPLKIQSKIRIRDNARFMIATKGMLGDRYVEIQPLKQEAGNEHPFITDGQRVLGARFSGISELADDAKPIMEQLKEITVQLKRTTKKFDEEVMTPETAGDIRESIKKLRSVLFRADDLLSQAQRGKGPLAKLLNDPKMANDLTSLISNLRQHGVLFYSDSSDRNDDTSKPKKEHK